MEFAIGQDGEVVEAACCGRVDCSDLLGGQRRRKGDFGDAGGEIGQHGLEMGSSTAPNEPEVIRHRHALFGGEAAERKAGGGFGVAGFESDRELGLDGDIEQDVEELGALLHRQEVSGEVGWFDPPADRPLDLGSAFAADLVDVGVVPEILRGAGEPAVAVEKARCVGERCPTEAFELGVEGQMDAYIEVVGVGQVVGRMASPRPGHHQCRGRGAAVAEGAEARCCRGVCRPHEVGGQDQESVVVAVAECPGE